MKRAEFKKRMKQRKSQIAVWVLCIGLCTACGNAGKGPAEPVMGTTLSLPSETELTTQKESETESAAQSETTKTMKEIYEEVVETIEQPQMVTLNDNYIANYYGIDLSLLEDYLFANAEDVIFADTIVLMKVKEKSSAQTMKDALDKMIAQKKLELENYLPEQFQIVEKSEVIVSETYVYLVISEKAKEIENVITQYLK